MTIPSDNTTLGPSNLSMQESSPSKGISSEEDTQVTELFNNRVRKVHFEEGLSDKESLLKNEQKQRLKAKRLMKQKKEGPERDLFKGYKENMDPQTKKLNVTGSAIKGCLDFLKTHAELLNSPESSSLDQDIKKLINQRFLDEKHKESFFQCLPEEVRNRIYPNGLE